MTAASSRSRLTRALLFGLSLGVLLASSAAARPADVVEVSIVTDAASGRAVPQPKAFKAADGDTIKICNNSHVIPQLFSFAPYNAFAKKSGSGVRLQRGACTTVVVHNPTAKDLPVLIRSEIQDSVAFTVTVSPACKQRRGQSVGVSCSKPAAAAGTFVLVSSKLTDNPYGKEVSVTASPSGSATWKRCCDGAQWTTKYSWRFPSTLIPGKAFPISMSIKTVKVVPSQPLADQMTALAPDFRQDLTTQYPGQPSANKAYTVPFSKVYKDDPNNKQIKLYVGFAHATVVFTYKRT